VCQPDSGDTAPMRISHRLLPLFLLALALVTSSGCAWSPKIGSDYDTTVHFGRWRTWAWAPQPVGHASASLHDTRIRRSAEATLAERGYEQVDASEADFLLTYRVQIAHQQDVVVWDDPGAGYRWRRGRRPMHTSVHTYKVGSCIIDIVQAATGNIVWQGWAEAEIHDSTSAELRDQRIDQAIRETLDQFPPR